MPVVVLPANGSRIHAPGLVEARMMRARRASGFCVGCLPCDFSHLAMADARRHDEFIARLNHDYFKPISDRVEFMSYDKLDRFYEGMMLQQKSLLNL